LSAVAGAVIVAGGLMLSGGEKPAGAGSSGAGQLPVRSQFDVPKNGKAVVKVYVGGKLKRADTLKAADDGMILHIKEQLIKSSK
jgi:hypothetical protein